MRFGLHPARLRSTASSCRPPNALPTARIPDRGRGPCSPVARSPCFPARAAASASF